jgi:hypothetical protein
MKTTNITSLCILLVCFSMLSTTVACKKTPKHHGLTADEWRDVFSDRTKLADYSALKIGASSQNTSKVSEWEAFCQDTHLSIESIDVLRELLENDGEPNNRKLRNCALDCIQRHKEDAKALIPTVASRLSSPYLCERISALVALQKMGEASVVATNEIAACLGSSCRSESLSAVSALSVFGARSSAYLPILEAMLRASTNSSSKACIEQAIIKIRESPQQGGGEERR